MSVSKSDRELKLGNDFVVSYLRGTDLVDVCAPSAPDFTFVDQHGTGCALETKRLSFPLTSKRFKVWSQRLMASLPAWPLGAVIRLVVEWPREDADPLAWLEGNTEWIARFVAQAIAERQGVWVGSVSLPGATTYHASDHVLVEVGFLSGRTPTVEVSLDGPGRIAREDLLSKADHQLGWGRKRGMGCLFLAEVVDEDRDQARQWLSDRLGDGSAYPHIDQAYVGWPNVLDGSGSTWVYASAWKRDEP